MNMGKSYWTIWLATLLFFAAFYTLMIPLPLYLTGIGLPDWQVGVILGAMGVTSLIVRPLAGVLSDGWGRQKVMLLGTGALVVGSVGVSMTTHPILLFGLRGLQATGYVAFTTAATALISDLATPEKRSSAMAVFGVAANVAMTTVPALVYMMLDKITLTGAFWLSGAVALVGGLMALRVKQVAPPEKQNFAWPDLFRMTRKLLTPWVVTFLFGAGFGAFYQFTPLLTERRNLGSAGLVFTVYGLSIISTRLITGRFLDRVNRGLILSIAFLLLGLGLTGFAFAVSEMQLLAAVVMVAMGSGILHPLLITIHLECVSANERGRASAVFYLGFDLGIGLGAWIFAPTFQWFGLTGLYLLAAIAAFSGLVPVWWMVSPLQKAPFPTPAKSKT